MTGRGVRIKKGSSREAGARLGGAVEKAGRMILHWRHAVVVAAHPTGSLLSSEASTSPNPALPARLSQLTGDRVGGFSSPTLPSHRPTIQPSSFPAPEKVVEAHFGTPTRPHALPVALASDQQTPAHRSPRFRCVTPP